MKKWNTVSSRKTARIWLFFLLSLFFFPLSFTFAREWDLPWIDLVTRSEWGAEESMRFRENYPSTPSTSSTSSKPQTEAQQKAAEKAAKESAGRTAFMKANYPTDWSYSSTKADLDGHTLLYPDQIQHHKTKLVVHHTAMAYDTTRNQEQIKQHLQQIYKYHTLDRDFGDIGYNFLIDHLGNIYEGRAGGEGAVGMHVSYNNVTTLGISLMGNFEETQPTQAQVDALTNLLTALAKKYQIDPTAYEDYFQPSSTSPYVTVKKLPTIVGHGDIAATRCPWEWLHSLLPFIRSEVAKRLKGEMPSQVVVLGGSVAQPSKEVSVSKPTASSSASAGSSSDFSTRLHRIQQTSPELLQAVVQLVRERYKGALPKATNFMEKLAYKWTLDEVKKVQWSITDEIPSGVPVLLYELTTQYRTYEVKCEGNCLVNIDHQLAYMWPFQATFTVGNDGILIQSSQIKPTKAAYVLIGGGENVIEVTNYARKSYAGIPRNTFRDFLIFQKDTYKTVDGTLKNDYVVINQLSLTNYLKGVIETNDQEHLEKNKVMALLAKNYLLFYLDKKNVHPSIPAEAGYAAIDSPEMFQKYVGAGAEKTLTKRYQALEATKNQVVMYSGTLPILPYFSCSVGFTLSAEEKRWWKDTPYLQSVFDFVPCKEFEGHGVGLAGKGAEYFAQKGMKAEEILQWYYPWVEVVSLIE